MQNAPAHRRIFPGRITFFLSAHFRVHRRTYITHSFILDEVAGNDSPCLTWVSSHVPRAEQGRVFTPTLLRESDRERGREDW